MAETITTEQLLGPDAAKAARGEVLTTEQLMGPSPKESFLSRSLDPYRASLRMAEVGASGFNEGIKNLATTAGLPVDIVNATLARLGIPVSKAPIMGTEFIRHYAEKLFPERIKPQGLGEEIASSTGEQVAYALPAARGVAIAKGGLETARQVAPMVAGAGTASGAIRTIAPNSPILDIAAQVVGGVGAGLATAKNIPKTLTEIEGAINQTIDKGIRKGIRPSAGGQQTFAQMEKYNQKAREAVKTIIKEVPNLKLVDESGEVVSKLPETLHEFSQSIDQTKRAVFTRYDAMKVAAGEQGAAVNLRPVAKELVSVVNSKVLNDLSPDVVKYASTRLEAFANRGAYTATEAQDAITHLNNSLQAFYKNPTYETASKAYVDSLIANRLRKGLDDVIENTIGEGYQDLKNTYGSLKHIERDVNRRAVVDARKNTKGLIDFSDVFSGGEAVRGLISMNPAMVGKAVAMKGIANLYKYLNSPNRIIKDMFQEAGGLMKQGGMLEKPPTRVPGVHTPEIVREELPAGQQPVGAVTGRPEQRALPPVPVPMRQETGFQNRPSVPPTGSIQPPLRRPVAALNPEAPVAEIINQAAKLPPGPERKALITQLRTKAITSGEARIMKRETGFTHRPSARTLPRSQNISYPKKIGELPLPTGKLEIDDLTRPYVEQLRKDVRAGQPGSQGPTRSTIEGEVKINPYASTYPDFMRDKGWTKAEVEDALNNLLSSKKLGSRQQKICEAAIEDSYKTMQIEDDMATEAEYLRQLKEANLPPVPF